MAMRYEIWLKFEHYPLNLDFRVFNDYPQPTLEQLHIYPLGFGKLEIHIIFAEHDDEKEFLQLLDKFVANETKNNSNKLIAADFDGLESHSGGLKMDYSILKLRHLPLDRMRKLRQLNTHLFILKGKEKKS